MSTPNTILEALAAWLAAQQFNPAVREVAVCPVLPPAACPQLALYCDSEKLARGTDSTLALRIKASCAAGRPADAQSAARDLAQQVRGALAVSQCLGGSVKLLAGDTITYGVPATGEPTVATAEVAVTVKYVA
jgi:hypothetical protein